MDARKHHRYNVMFKSQMSAPGAPEALGVITDMSMGGCRVTSMMTVPAGTELRLRIPLGDDYGEIEVSKAVIRWVRGMEFGVEFLEFSNGTSEQLVQALNTLNA